MNTGLLVLLIIPLLGLAEQTPPQNINDLGLWLQKWQIQEAEHLNELSEYLNDLSTTGGRVATLIGILVDLNNGTNQQNTLLQEDELKPLFRLEELGIVRYPACCHVVQALWWWRACPAGGQRHVSLSECACSHLSRVQ